MNSKYSFLALLLSMIFVFTSCEDENKVKVAMCQIFCLDGDREGNFVRIENAVNEAKNKGANIICFPETSILGWVNIDAHERAFPIPGKDSERLCQLARNYEVYLCVGLAEKEGDNLYDTVILIDDLGNILLKHRKINILSELMIPSYTPGEEVHTVETKYGVIGMMICADSFLQDYVDQMKSLNPDLVLIPYGWAAPEDDWPEHAQNLENIVAKVAATIGCPVVGTDLVGEITKGPWTGQVYGGQSVAVDQDGRVLAKALDRDRDIKVFEIVL